MACVPTTIPASPFAMFANTFDLLAPVTDPVNNSTWVPSSLPPSSPLVASAPINFFIVLKCCPAKTSVGASNAACPPASTAASIARRATIVFPLPTSPWSNRCIG